MVQQGFSERELNTFRKLGLESIAKNLATGFNYYPDSVELNIADSVAIPVKYGHRNLEFITLLEKAVDSEFKGKVEHRRFPRIVVYRWKKMYRFPAKEDKIRIFDVNESRYITNQIEYQRAGKELIAEGQDLTIVFKPAHENLVSVINFISKKGSFYLTAEDGSLIPTSKGSRYPFKLNPDRISDEAYMTPMIITSYDLRLARELPAFMPVKKLYIIKGKQEISVYLDKTFKKFVSMCRVKFEEPITRLANKLFRDFINFEQDPRLPSS